MELLKKLSTKEARPVTDFEQIRIDAFAMIEQMDEGFKRGEQYTHGAALHHAQVSDTPFNFFVVAHQYCDVFGGGRLRRIVINPKITDQQDYMAFQEGCLSFLDRDHIKTKRFNRVSLSWQYANAEGEIKQPWPKQSKLTGFPAFLVQHECDHGKGFNIYDGRFDEFNPRVELSKEK